MQMTQMTLNFVKKQHSMIERDNIEILDVGPWGVQWRGADIPKPNSMYENDYTPQFGFSCAGCGASVVNQEKLNHSNKCDSKSPYIERNENETY
jgi:hypothetical protein